MIFINIFVNFIIRKNIYINQTYKKKRFNYEELFNTVLYFELKKKIIYNYNKKITKTLLFLN